MILSAEAELVELSCALNIHFSEPSILTDSCASPPWCQIYPKRQAAYLPVSQLQVATGRLQNSLACVTGSCRTKGRRTLLCILLTTWDACFKSGRLEVMIKIPYLLPPDFWREWEPLAVLHQKDRLEGYFWGVQFKAVNSRGLLVQFRCCWSVMHSVQEWQWQDWRCSQAAWRGRVVRLGMGGGVFVS